MTKLLLMACGLSRANPEDPGVRQKYGILSGAVGIICNLLLSAGKLAVGLLFASVSIVADALNNLSDAGASLVSIISFRISAKPADKKHPFGHARIEYVASMAVAFLILLVSVELLTESVNKIRYGGEQNFSYLSVIVLGCAIGVKLWLGLFNRRLGKRIRSEVLLASSFDSFSDALASLAVLVCLLISHFTAVDLDGYVGVCVSIVIAIAGIKILNDTKNSILGESPDEETVLKIKKIVSEYPEILGIHDMVVHQYGPSFAMVSLHAEVDGKRDFFEMHDVIDNVEQKLNTEMNVIATIHMDPIVVDDPRTSKLKQEVLEIVCTIDERLNIHDFRFVDGISHVNLIFDIEAPFDFAMENEELKALVGQKILTLDERYRTVISVDRC